MNDRDPEALVRWAVTMVRNAVQDGDIATAWNVLKDLGGGPEDLAHLVLGNAVIDPDGTVRFKDHQVSFPSVKQRELYRLVQDVVQKWRSGEPKLTDSREFQLMKDYVNGIAVPQEAQNGPLLDSFTARAIVVVEQWKELPVYRKLDVTTFGTWDDLVRAYDEAAQAGALPSARILTDEVSK